MRSPKKMLHIQIDITNACNKSCSNCTRFCGNYKKPFYMNFDTFKRAVDSLEGYGGTYGIIGGEPTLHPEFERFARYISSKFEPSVASKMLVYPQKEFIQTQHRFEDINRSDMEVDGEVMFRTNGPGLWSNMGATYKKYYEVISDSFCVQYLNDHMNPSYHQPGLFARRDLGIPDEEWYKLRDACWIQNEWSATITPKGAFFCEIAGALDMLFDGPGGWKIESDWWKREPKDFGDQLQWCELCGFALDTFTRDSAEEIDDISPTLYKMLDKVNSPKLKSGRINLVKIENGIINEESKKENKRFSPGMPYIEHYEDRFNALNSVLFTYDFDEVTIAEGDNFGIMLNKAIIDANDWILFNRSGTPLPEDFKERLSNYVLNPGTLHISDDFALFSRNSISLRCLGFDRIAHATSFNDIIKEWQTEKVIPLSFEVFDNANKRPQFGVGVKYAIWGTGSAGSMAVDAIRSAGGELVVAVDKDCTKYGRDFYGVAIQSPEALLGSDFDVLIAANYTRFSEIKREAIEMGVDAAKIKYVNVLV